MLTPEAQPTGSNTLTERQAFADLLAWAANRPVWQRDAAPLGAVS